MKNQTHLTLDSRSFTRGKRRLLPIALALPLLAITGAESLVHGLVLQIPENARSVKFQKDGVAVAPTLTLEPSAPDQKLEQASIVLTENFMSAEDSLEVSGTLPAGLTKNYDQTSGKLTLSGRASVEAYQKALRMVRYNNTKQKPSGGPRTVQISIGSSLYYEGTGHYYEFVSAPGSSWTSARAAAKSREKYYGLQGYLVTVTSKGEDEFIASKLQGQGWLGATDAGDDKDHDKEWKWVTGPEAGTTFFYQKGYKSGEANSCGVGPAAQPSQPGYANWAAGEPNDYNTGCKNKEDYAHFKSDGQWNDYPDNAGSNIAGYVVEYGGMRGETQPQLSRKVTITAASSPAPTDNSHGDVHMRTPDGLVFDFQAAGEFVLVRSGDGKVQVQTRQEKWSRRPSVSLNTAVAMSVLEDTVGIYLSGVAVGAQTSYLDVNGQSKVLAVGERMQLPKGGHVQRLAAQSQWRKYHVEWPGGFVVGVLVIPGTCINVGVSKPDGAQTTYEGLLGNLNGDPKDDLVGRNGRLTPPASLRQLNTEFGPKWCVPSGDSLFSRGERVPCTFPEKALTVQDLSAEEREFAGNACTGITDQTLGNNCMLDVGVTGDESFAESAKSVQTTWPAKIVAGDRTQGSNVCVREFDKITYWMMPRLEAAYCAGSENSPESVRCLDRVFSNWRNVIRGPFREYIRDEGPELDTFGQLLCRGSRDAERTVVCFELIVDGRICPERAERIEMQIAEGYPWQELMREIGELCRAP